MLRRVRPSALSTPAVTVESKPNGLPMATANCPTRSRAESPNAAKGSPLESACTIARSVQGSAPTTRPAPVNYNYHYLSYSAGINYRIADSLAVFARYSKGSRANADKILFTTGRLTSEMIIKTVRMGIPILVSRSGFTAWGVDLARQVGLTLVGRAKGKRFIALAGQERIVYDQNLAFVAEESARHKRKGDERDE